MNKIPNIDFFILFSLPIALICGLITLSEKALFFYIILICVLFFFQLVIYRKRYIFGYSGILNFSIPSIVLTTYSIFIALPSVYVCSVNEHEAIYPYFYSIISFYFFYPAGLFLADSIWKIDYQRTNKIYKQPMEKSKYDIITSDYLWLVLPVILVIAVLFVFRINQIPLVELFLHPGDYARLSVLRDQSYLVAGISSIEKYIIAWQRAVFIPTLIVGSLFLYICYQRKAYLYIFITSFIVGILFNSLTLEKSPVAAIFLSLMAFYYLHKNKLNLKVILLAITLTFAIPVLIMAIKFYREEGLFELLYISTLNRIFLVPAKALYAHYVMFPSLEDFLWGRSTNLFAWMHPDGGFPLSNYVARFWWKEPQATGTLNATYLAFFWADFGAIGVIISSFFVGFITQWVYYTFLTIADYKKNILYVIFSTCMLPAFTFSFFNSNFTILLVTRGVLLTLILLVLIKHLANKLAHQSLPNH